MLAALWLAALSCGGPAIDRSVIVFSPAPVLDPGYAASVGLTASIRVGETAGNSIPVAGVTLLLRAPDGGAVVAQAVSDSAGRVRIDAVPAGSYELTATVPRPSGATTLRVTDRLRPVRLTIPAGGGRMDLVLLARYLPGSARLITAVELVDPTGGDG